MDNKHKEMLKMSVLSWFVYMATLDDEPDKLILHLDKYLTKRKPNKVNIVNQELLTNKLLSLKDWFEYEITLEEERHLLSDKTKEVRTLSFSPTLLAIQMLDNMILDGNTELRVRYGHIDTGAILVEIEESYPELASNSYKILNRMLKEIK